MFVRYPIILRLIFLLFCLSSCPTPLHAMDASQEIHHYQEVTGDSVKAVAWRLTKGNNFVLTYSSPVQRHVTITEPSFETRSWRVVAANGQTCFRANRIGRSITVQGMFKGEPVDKKLEIDPSPWYQATSLSLRELLQSNDSERVFWTIRLDTLSAHKIKAIKQGIEFIESDGRRQEVQRIRLTLPGLLAPFWKSDYWFVQPEGIFYRFKGPSGPPGSPMTTVTRIEK